MYYNLINEFDEKLFFEVIGNWINFRLGSFLYQGTLWQKIQAAVSYAGSYCIQNIYANQHRNNPNLVWFPTFDIQNSSEVVLTQVTQNRGLT